MKKSFIWMIAAALLTTALMVAAVAESLDSNIKRVEYEGNGVVEVDFIADVRYNDVRLVVKNPAGEEIPAQIINTDDDDIKFRVESAVPGETYDFTFTGIETRRMKEAINASGSFRVPAEGEVAIRKIEYDQDGEIEVDFNGVAAYGDVKATISSPLGGKFEVVITEMERDGFEGYVNGLDYGGIYTLTISGVGTAGDISAEFVAVD